MKTAQFSDYRKGILFDLLMDAYSLNPGITHYYKKDWIEFDTFVFENLHFMNNNGFISHEDAEPIGFISWDSRYIPDYAEIGHNCIINKYKGLGKGKEQLSCGINRIKLLHPVKILVRTGSDPFFLPARKMYESAGFIPTRTVKQDNGIVPEIIEYELIV